MEKLKLIIELIKAIIWPTLVMTIIMMFRKQIMDKFKDIKNVEFPGGFKLALNEAKAIIEETKTELMQINLDKNDKLFIVDQLKRVDMQINKIEIVNEKIIMDVPETETSEKDEIENRTLLAFAAGESLTENLKYNIYYDNSTRSHNSPFKFIGLYAHQEIVAVGKLNKIVYCNLEEGELIVNENYDDNKLNDFYKLNDEEKTRIKEIIENTEVYDIAWDHKFFLVDKFYETKFHKISNGGLRSKKYFWLDEIPGFKEGMTADQIARLLDEKEWE